MLRNLLITIVRGDNLSEAEAFNWDFAGIGYYYFIKLKKIKFPGFSYIKINIANTTSRRKLKSSITAKVLYIHYNYDFTEYLKSSTNEKTKIQYKLASYIFKNIFKEYDLDQTILSEVSSEISENKQQMSLLCLSKKIGRQYQFNLKMILNIDNFMFVSEVIGNNIYKRATLIKSIPTYFVIHYLFGGYKIEGMKILIGNKSHRVFEISIPENQVVIAEKGIELVKKWSIS